MQQHADHKGWIPALHIRDMTSEWPQYRTIRFHMTPDDDTIPQRMEEAADGGTGTSPLPNEQPYHDSSPGRLSPIPEGTEPPSEADDDDDRQSLLRLFYEHEDTKWQTVLDEVLVDATASVENLNTKSLIGDDEEVHRIPLGQYVVDHICPVLTHSHLVRNEDLPNTVDLLFPYPTSNLVAMLVTE